MSPFGGRRGLRSTGAAVQRTADRVARSFSRAPSPVFRTRIVGSGGLVRNARRFWIYAAFALIYGICETLNGNWSQLDMTTELGASSTVASLALTAFWGMVTVGRILFAAARRWIPPRLPYHFLPLVLAGAFAFIASLQHGNEALGLVAFGLAGLGCSALLPLTISFSQEEMTAFTAGITRGVIAFYQMATG